MASQPATTPRAHVPDLPSFIPSVPVFDGEDTLDAVKEGEAFLSRFSSALEKQDWDAFANLFCDDAFWKDNLTITWDRRTLWKKEKIAEAWRALYDTRKPALSATPHEDALGLPTAFTRLAPTLASLDVPFCFTTQSPRTNCVGLAKLVPQDGTWKIWILATKGCALQDHPFASVPRQTPSLVPDSQRGKSHAQGLPKVHGVFDAVIVGGSSSGVATAAAFDSIGLDAICFERFSRPGGHWAEGGRAYVTLHHTPKAVGFPEVPIPEKFYPDMNGPMITEYIASTVEKLNLPVFCGVKVVSNTWNPTARLWEICIEDVSTKEQGSVQARNVILALGAIANGANPYVPQLANREQFHGPVQHQTEYKDPKLYEGKKVLIVGAANSGHDIARDLVDGGVTDVTLLQRGPTSYFRWETIGGFIDGVYATPLKLDTADFLYNLSMPLGVARDLSRGAMAAMEASQADLYTQLEAKGLSIMKDRCFVTRVFSTRNGSILMDRQNHIDYILNDRFKVARGEAVGFAPEGLVVREKSGEEKTVEADGIVLATGFETIDLPKIWGETGFVDRASAAHLANPCSMDVDEEGEFIAKPFFSGHPNLYFGAYNIIGHRFVSKMTAMQIMASLKGEAPQRFEH